MRYSQPPASGRRWAGRGREPVVEGGWRSGVVPSHSPARDPTGTVKTPSYTNCLTGTSDNTVTCDHTCEQRLLKPCIKTLYTAMYSVAGRGLTPRPLTLELMPGQWNVEREHFLNALDTYTLIITTKQIRLGNKFDVLTRCK